MHNSFTASTASCFSSSVPFTNTSLFQEKSQKQKLYLYHSNPFNNIKTPEYIKWFSMFVRCYDEKYLKKEPTYVGCEVGEEFLCFQNFANWYNTKIYECKYPLELDKDLLYRGNKIYKPSTCCFIPKEINATINSKRDDLNVMKYLYDKYSKHVPHYIKTKLYELATVGD